MIRKNRSFTSIIKSIFYSEGDIVSSVHVERTMVRLTGAIQAVSGSCEIKRTAQQLETT